MAFWPHFRVLGGLVAILGRLGEKLGYLERSWPQVGTLLAACWDKYGEDDPREANLGRKWVAKGDGRRKRWCAPVDARGVWARVGGCLELEFRDLEGLDGVDTRFNTLWRLPLAGAGGSTVPNLRL